VRLNRLQGPASAATGRAGDAPALLLRLFAAQWRLPVRPSLAMTIASHPARESLPVPGVSDSGQMAFAVIAPQPHSPCETDLKGRRWIGGEVIDKCWFAVDRAYPARSVDLRSGGCLGLWSSEELRRCRRR
jgi:hypothetical protein